MCYHSHCEVIRRKTVVLAAEYLRCHVAGSSAGVCTVVGAKRTGDSEVGDPCVALPIEYDVLWLDVAVNDSAGVEIAKAEEHADKEELGLFLSEATAGDVMPKVPAR